MNTNEVPDVDFRTQIAEELTRQELIDRLCEYHEQIKELKKQVENDRAFREYYEDDDEDDRDYDDYDDEPDYSDFDCTCGAWQWSKEEGKPIHVADCCCGSSEPWF